MNNAYPTSRLPLADGDLLPKQDDLLDELFA